MAVVTIEEKPVTIWDEFTMRRDNDSPTQLRVPYSPKEWAALTPETKEVNRQAEFAKWQANMDALRAAAAEAERAGPVVPESITMDSAQRIMFQIGVIDQVLTFAKANPDAWEAFWTRPTMERQNPFLLKIAPMVWPNLDPDQLSAQLDALFLQGDPA